jgi:hypothetical protein
MIALMHAIATKGALAVAFPCRKIAESCESSWARGKFLTITLTRVAAKNDPAEGAIWISDGGGAERYLNGLSKVNVLSCRRR